jgi:beta-N-acetylhexosaminidase
MPKRSSSDLQHQVGQLLIMGFDGSELSSRLRELLTTLQPGGLILFARNIQSPQQTWELLRDCQHEMQVPLFLGVDMEGGKVDRFRNALSPAPSAAAVAATGDKKVFRQHGRVIGDAVRALGFNVDFAPALDLAFEASRSALASRAVSADPSQTIVYAREFLRGLRDARVLGCGKHFPGLGEAQLDTHYELPTIEKPFKRLWQEDMLPYRRMHRELPFVMVCHATYPSVTRDHTPASLSKKWITEILRNKIGYRGLILSDDLDMGGVLAAARIEQAAVETIRAGTDIFLICQKEENVQPAWEAVLREAERDRKFARRVTEASHRVLKAKKKHLAGGFGRPAPSPTKAVVERLQRELWELGEQARLGAFGKEPA